MPKKGRDSSLMPALEVADFTGFDHPGGAGPAKLRTRQKRISAALTQLGVRVVVWGDARLLGAS